jgi:hypothetical protein
MNKNSGEKAALILYAPSSDPESSGTLILDFAILKLSSVVAIGLKRALLSEMGHNLFDTQRKGFQALKLLAQYLHEQESADIAPLPADVLHGFARWLNESSRGPSAQAALNTTRRLLSWCQRNTPGVVSAKATFRVRAIRDTNASGKPIAELDLKGILTACYREIEIIEKRLEQGRRLITGECSDPAERSIYELIRELLRLGKGSLPTQYVVNRSGNAYARRIEDLGGHQAVSRMLWLSPEDLLPFYLAIVVQTSGNPDAIKGLTRQSIHAHPLRADLERLQWMKQRSGKEQYADFPVGRQWSAPSLVRRLMRLNHDLLIKCTHQFRNHVFISHNPKAKNVRVPARDVFHKELLRFIERNSLASFHFRDIRKAGAREHHRAAGSIMAAKKRLNHESVLTTARYTSLGDRAKIHEDVIRRFQGEMVRLSMASPVNAPPTIAPVSKASQAAETIFGFKCKNPFSGIVAGSSEGNLCLQFTRCATCPGAVVTVDDPSVVARLLAASSALEDAKRRAISEGWWPRYALLYEPTREILETQLLPAVHPLIKDLAEKTPAGRLIPILE